MVETGEQHRGRTAWVDAGAGVAGDMLLAALLDAGASAQVVRRDVAAVLAEAVDIEIDQVSRSTMRATAVRVRLREPDQPHRSWVEVRAMIERADLPDRVRRDALAAFAALARAEARVHGVQVDDVHFHEVGAWDSIADVVGVCAALADLQVQAVSASAVCVGNGYARTAHGLMPVPVPAVAELLTHGDHLARALPIESPGSAARSGELATPTGVAILVALAQHRADLPTGPVAAVGVGAGSRDDLPWPNVVRVLLGPLPGPPEPSPDAGTEPNLAGLACRDLDELSANIDDLDPRLWPGVIEALLAAGARDAWLTPIQMKKGRPALTLSALCDPTATTAVRAAVFATTTTFGVRSQQVRRHELDRAHVTVEVELGGRRRDVAVKIGSHRGRIVRATPEYEEVAGLARDTGVAVLDALTAAAHAAHAAGLRAGRPAPGPPRSSPQSPPDVGAG